MILRELVNLIKFDVDEASLRSAEGKINNIIAGLDRFGKRMSLFVTAPTLALAGFATKVASDTNEIQNKFNQVFGDLSTEANDFVGAFSKSVGRYRGDVMEGMSAFQSMFVGLGYGNDEAAKMSRRMQELAIDFGSFNNLADKEAIERFISALSGSSEVTDKFGINLKQAALESELQAMGLGKSAAQATEAEKALARLNIIEKTMGRQGAIGDAVRTLDQYANSQRAFVATIKNSVVWIGEKLMPILVKFFNFGTKLLNWVDGLNDSVKTTALIFAGLLAAVGPLALGLAGLLTVVKALMVFNTFVGGLAGLRGALIFALQPQFLLIAAAIIAAVAALALFTEDLITWVQGGDSLIGRLLGPWEEWRDGLKEIFSLVREDFDTFIRALGIAIVDTFTDLSGKLSSLSSKLENSTFGKIFKYILSPIGLVESGAGLLGSITGGVSTLPAKFTAVTSERFGRISEGVGRITGTRNVNVDSRITLQVPPGSTQQQVESVEAAARRAVKESFNQEVRELFDNEVGVR